jgi:N-acetylneuraminate synthase
MPPFPWHFGGQRFHNLFVDPVEINNVCKITGLRVCFDISHSKLACNYYNWSFTEYIKTIGETVAHLHIADASGVDGEGLQIGEGEMDFYAVSKQLKISCPNATFIPEVWQGHKNNGDGFWQALSLLENYL